MQFELPDKRDINSASVVAFAEIRPDRSSLNFFRELAQLLPDGTKASLTAAFGSSRFVMLRIEPGVKDPSSAINIKTLDCSLVLNGAPFFGGWGDISIDTFDFFALLFLNSAAETMVLNAFAVSFPWLSISEILNCFSLKFDVAEELDFLTIEPLTVVSQKMDTTVFTKSYDEIAAAFSSVRTGSCGGRPASDITGEDILIKNIPDGKGGISVY